MPFSTGEMEKQNEYDSKIFWKGKGQCKAD